MVWQPLCPPCLGAGLLIDMASLGAGTGTSFGVATCGCETDETVGQAGAGLLMASFGGGPYDGSARCGIENAAQTWSSRFVFFFVRGCPTLLLPHHSIPLLPPLIRWTWSVSDLFPLLA